MNSTCKIKRQDQVEIISGKDKGRVGKILRVYPHEQKVIVEKINIVKRHTKPRQSNQQGGIIEKEAPIHISNLNLICPKCSKTVRFGKKILEDGTKVRVCKQCSESVELK